MKILIDSREQLPLEFIDPYVTETEVIALPVGDYSCEYKEGWQCPIIFERKTVGDLFNTLTHHYKRFKREIERSKDMGVKLIILVEGSLTTVYEGIEHSKRGGETVVKQIFTLWVKYDIPTWYFCGNELNIRFEMSRFIIETYSALGRKAMRDMRGKK